MANSFLFALITVLIILEIGLAFGALQSAWNQTQGIWFSYRLAKGLFDRTFQLGPFHQVAVENLTQSTSNSTNELANTLLFACGVAQSVAVFAGFMAFIFFVFAAFSNSPIRQSKCHKAPIKWLFLLFVAQLAAIGCFGYAAFLDVVFQADVFVAFQNMFSLDTTVPTLETTIGVSLYLAAAVVVLSIPIMCILYCNRKRISRMARIEHDDEEPMIQPARVRQPSQKQVRK